MDVDASERRPDGGGRGRNTPRRRDAGAAARRGARMRKRPELRIIQGSKLPDDGRLYRLPRGRGHESAAVVIEWPRAGAWRELIHRLLRNPIVTE
jgi:hypothetical protein